MGIDTSKYNINIGTMKKGARNAITDVKGVKVGHVTLKEGDARTGVTAILPHEGNIFKEKVVAATHVINGFGKSIGTVQIDELGTIETPIVLTNTLSVGTAATALVKYMLEQNEDIGDTTGTVNPVVCECNDGNLNCIRKLFIKEEHVFEALKNASEDFEEGDVGGGTGMMCYGLKGGIGTASRIVELDGEEYTIGVLVMSNFGATDRLIVDGDKLGKRIKDKWAEEDKGSIIIILATDIPVNERQLKRLCKRVPAGLARTGSYYGNGSGDVVYAFTTANKVRHYEEKAIVETKTLHEDKINSLFIAVTEGVEEAVISSLLHAETVTGRNGRVAHSLTEYMDL
ncbi:MAG: P1 family peptidase [Clostridia bacterium]|nr:P1 family peptidase [Clostridia bacterium]